MTYPLRPTIVSSYACMCLVVVSLSGHNRSDPVNMLMGHILIKTKVNGPPDVDNHITLRSFLLTQ